jgi:hypothetical protein
VWKVVLIQGRGNGMWQLYRRGGGKCRRRKRRHVGEDEYEYRQNKEGKYQRERSEKA